MRERTATGVVVRRDGQVGPLESGREQSAVLVMARVICALLLRETRVRYGRSQVGFLWAIVEPLAGIIALAVAFSYIGRVPEFGRSLLLFFGLGYLGFNLYRKLSIHLGSAFDANSALLHYPVVKRVDTLIARAILELSTGMLVIAIIIGGLMIYEDIPSPQHPHIFLVGIASLALIGFGTGSINAVVSSFFPSWRHLEGMLGRVLFLTSGVFFTPTVLPTSARAILDWNPIFHGIELMRYGYYEGYRPDFVSFEYLFGFGLITCVVGLSAERFLPRGEA